MNEKRLAQLQEMLRSEPNDTFLIYAMAQEYMAATDFTTALTWFSRLHTGQPDYLPTYYHYGLALLQCAEEEKALQVWREGEALALKTGDRKTAAEIHELLSDFDDEEDW
jgi:tetratricopeptide (TPR) repeat protein